MRHLAAAVSLAVPLSGCSAGLPRLLEPTEVDDGTSAAIVGLEVAGVGAARCTVPLVDEDGEAVLEIRAGDALRAVPIEAAPGRYGFGAPACPGARPRKLARKPIPFEVYEKRTSFLGDLIFVAEGSQWQAHYGNPLADGGGDDDDGADEERTDLSAPADRDGASSYRRLAALPKALRARLVSGYTGRPMKAARGRTKVLTGLRVQPLQSVTVGTLPARPLSLDSCVDAERAVNPVFAGQWKLQVHYRKGQFAGIETERDDHVFSDAFVQCVTKTIERHRPGVPGLAAYEISL
jgi:hypothetical protein